MVNNFVLLTNSIMKTNTEIVSSFISTIWNAKVLDRIHEFISEDYLDHSFLPAVPPTRAGLKTWIENTSLAFDHHTTIESSIAKDYHVALRITFEAKHIGKWRNIEATGRSVSVKGFRFFRLREKKIIEHWALIDGESLQTALTDQYHGCEISQR